MGARGPRPKPTIVQLSKGDPGKRAKARVGVEPMPVGSPGEPPETLDATGAAMWRAVIAATQPTAATVGRDWLTPCDEGVLFAFCTAWSTLQRNIKRVTKEGETHTIKDKLGSVIATPPTGAATLRDRALKDVVRFGAEIGLSPSARSRLNLAPTGDAAEAEFEHFLTGGRDGGA